MKLKRLPQQLIQHPDSMLDYSNNQYVAETFISYLHMKFSNPITIYMYMEILI